MKTFLNLSILLLLFFAYSCNKSNDSLSAGYSDEQDNSNKTKEYFVADLPDNFKDPIFETDLKTLKSKMVGTWFGKVETPWWDPYHIVFKFNESDIYSGYNITNNGLPAFYYGTDQDSSVKEFQIKDILADGSAEGEITLLFTTGTNIDIIKDLRFYNNFQNLKFTMWHHNQYGPVSVSLYRLN